MKNLNSWLERQLAICLIFSMAVPLGAAQTISALPIPHAAGTAGATQDQVPRAGLGNSVTLAEAASPSLFPDSPGTVLTQTASQSQPSQESQTTQQKQDSSSSTPVGTAAAPYRKQEGVSASNPAGAAIAPGKQRRIHTYAIRIGLLVGAAIAIGVVTAASLGSPGRPN